MNRREFAATLAGAALAWPIAPFAQTKGKVWRIGYLGGANRPANGLPPAALRETW